MKNPGIEYLDLARYLDNKAVITTWKIVSAPSTCPNIDMIFMGANLKLIGDSLILIKSEFISVIYDVYRNEFSMLY